eukprot:Nitzschia sp. Nitz4//scaffold206_size41850//13383//14260//NITZ4_007418-RA/size41850-processed-gene-0.50-mRNA-1//-1//CDS//3329541553//9051//frame0
MFLPGFELWVPPTPEEYDDGMPVYEIIGTDAQVVQFPLRPGHKIHCFSGAMAYMSDGITMTAKLGGFGRTFSRIAGGGSVFEIEYANTSNLPNAYIAMTPDYPGVIVPIQIKNIEKIVTLRDSYLCGICGLGPVPNVGAAFNPARSVGAFLCSGFDFLVQTVQQGDWIFLMAMGTVVKKTLNAGESILVDGDSLLCFESTITVDIRAVGSLSVMCCAGEGLFNTELTGPGTIWMQSFSIDKMRRLFPPPSDNGGGGGGDGGGGD